MNQDLEIIDKILSDKIFIEEHRRMARNRLRRRRLALAASILIPLAGTGGFAAFNLTKGNAAQTTEADGSKPIPVAAGRPVDRDRPAPPSLDVFATHPVVITRFTLHDRGSSVPILPKDPLRPWDGFEWVYVVPSHVIERRFDPESRELDILLNQDVAVSAKLQAREEIAAAYRANGHPDVTAEMINLQPLQRVGYAIYLKDGQGDLLVKEHKGIVLTGETLSVSSKIPADRLTTIDQLVRKPDRVPAVHSGLYRFELSQQASIEVKGLQSSVGKATETVFGKSGIPAGGIIDRKAKDKFLAALRHELTVTHREMGIEVDANTDRALKHLAEMQPLSAQDFRDLPKGAKIYSDEFAQHEMTPEEYDLRTKKTEEYLKRQAKLETFAKTVSDLARHERDDRSFYRKIQDAVNAHGEGDFDYMLILNGAFGVDFARSYENLVKEKSTAVSDLRAHALDEAALKTELLSETYKKFDGDNHRLGSTPKGWDLFVIDESRLLGETLFADHRVRVVGVDTVAIDEEFPLRVVPTTADSDPALAAKLTAFKEALESQAATLRGLETLVATQGNQIREFRELAASQGDRIKSLADNRIVIERLNVTPTSKGYVLLGCEAPGETLGATFNACHRVVRTGENAPFPYEEVDSQGHRRIRRFGKEVVQVFMIPTGGYYEMDNFPFVSFDAGPYDKNAVEIQLTGRKKTAAFHFAIYVAYKPDDSQTGSMR